jgi:maltose alpha-D-glucosyltransferase/alpha-amylase
MTERLNNYIERILARRPVNTPGKKGTITDPVAFDELEPELQTLLGSRASEEARIMGKRTAEMHLALASATEKDLKPEEYSLHYQRSLYSSMQSLVREAYQNLQRHYSGLPDEIRADAAALLHRRDEMLGTLKRIYTRKLDIWKTRIHGSLVLKKLLMTGRDIVIQDFGGNPYRSFSERRIKRSPVRDISEMMMSFHYTAYHVFTSNGHIPKAEFPSMLPYADIWAHYMSGFFLKAYINKVGGSQLLPKEHADFDVVLRTFLIERALVHFNYEISTGNGQLMAPLRMLNSVMAASASSYEPVRE